MELFKVGDIVRQVVTPIEGKIVDILVADGQVSYKVSHGTPDNERVSLLAWNQVEAA